MKIGERLEKKIEERLNEIEEKLIRQYIYIMDNIDWLNYKIQVRDRLRTFTLKILEFSEMFSNTQEGRIINNIQIESIRSNPFSI